jgi:hypothetical protein
MSSITCHNRVRQFPALRFGPSFSMSVNFCPAIWSVIFQVRHFPALRYGPSVTMSVIFLPCDLVRHFPVLQFQVLHFQRPQTEHVLDSLDSILQNERDSN